jgi:hypothetical protein
MNRISSISSGPVHKRSSGGADRVDATTGGGRGSSQAGALMAGRPQFRGFPAAAAGAGRWDFQRACQARREFRKIAGGNRLSAFADAKTGRRGAGMIICPSFGSRVEWVKRGPGNLVPTAEGRRSAAITRVLRFGIRDATPMPGTGHTGRRQENDAAEDFFRPGTPNYSRAAEPEGARIAPGPRGSLSPRVRVDECRSAFQPPYPGNRLIHPCAPRCASSARVVGTANW